MDSEIDSNESRLTTYDSYNLNGRLNTAENDIDDIEDGTTSLDAKTYKGNDIDSDGDGKVDNADNADNADSADKVDTSKQFQISSNIGGNFNDGPFSVSSGDAERMYHINLYIPDGKSLVLKELRYYMNVGAGLYVFTFGGTEYKTSSSNGIDKPNHTLYTNTTGSLEIKELIVQSYDLDDDGYSVYPSDSFWAELTVV